MKLRNAIVFGIVIAAIGLAPATAGTRQSYPVVLNASGAEGVMGSTRNTTDIVQILECEVHAYSSSRYGYCWARNTANQIRNCYAYDNHIIDNIQALATDDYVAFQYDATGRCTRVSVVKSSRWEPKAL